MSTFYYSNSEARKKIKKMEEIMGEKTFETKHYGKFYAEPHPGVYEDISRVSNLYPSLHPGSNLVAGKVQSIEMSSDATFQASVEVDCNLTNDLYDFIMRNICDSGKENNMTNMKNLKIKKVVFNPPATIVFWSDNTKTVVKSSNELYDGEKGLAMAIAKKALGNKGNYYNEFRKWIGDAPECCNCKYESCTLEDTKSPCYKCDDNYSCWEKNN